MAASYQDRIDCDFYGEKLIIHRRADCGDNFWFRAKIEGRANYIRRSCKTSDAAKHLHMHASNTTNCVSKGQAVVR